MKRRPILTADDFGLHREINKGIVELAACGRLDAVSVMFHKNSNLEFLDKLVATRVSVGCHLVLVEEFPLLPSSPSPMPMNYMRLFLGALASPARVAWVESEAEAQLRRASEEFGVELSFVNSHQHVHLIPCVWKTLYPVLNRYALPVRGCVQFRFGAIKQMLVEVASSIALKSTPCRQFSLIHPLGIQDAGHATVRSAIEAAKRATLLGEDCYSEMIIHPGRSGEDLIRKYGHWGYSWENEWQSACDGLFDLALASQCEQ